MTYAMLNDFRNFPRIKKEYVTNITNWYRIVQIESGNTLITIEDLIKYFQGIEDTFNQTGYKEIFIDVESKYNENDYYAVAYRLETDEEYIKRYENHIAKQKSKRELKEASLTALDRKLKRLQKEIEEATDKYKNLKEHLDNEEV